MKLRTVVVDDEPLARARILNLLKDRADIGVVAECRNGREAIDVIRRERPDLIFLDIQMPDMDGFKVLRKLNLPEYPMIVFATAYDKYALRAFDVHAIDYLLKPFDKDRFRDAIERATSQIELKKSSELNARLFRLLADYEHESREVPTSFLIRRGPRNITVRADDVYCVEAEGNYVAFHLEHQRYLYRSTLSAVAEELDPAKFLRIHRSYLVNRAFIKDVRYASACRYRVILMNDLELTSSRYYKDVISAVLDEPNERAVRE